MKHEYCPTFKLPVYVNTNILCRAYFKEEVRVGFRMLPSGKIALNNEPQDMSTRFLLRRTARRLQVITIS